MRMYQCDFYGCKERCPERATMAYDTGDELHFFCEDHRFAMTPNWQSAHVIQGDAMEEKIARKRPETNERAVGVQDLRETAKRLIAARDERLKDRLIMHALGVRWS